MNALSRGHVHLHPANRSWLEWHRLDADRVGSAAERFARFFGTTRYLAWQTLLVLAWITLNVVAVRLRWDPYPFILLNLLFSTQAAYAAPLILLAGNRQENRDKAAAAREIERAEVDYAHNLESLAIGRLLGRRLGVTDRHVADEVGALLAGESRTDRVQRIAAAIVPTLVSDEPPGGVA